MMMIILNMIEDVVVLVIVAASCWLLVLAAGCWVLALLHLQASLVVAAAPASCCQQADGVVGGGI